MWWKELKLLSVRNPAMTTNTVVTLFTVALAMIAGYLSSQQEEQIMAYVVALPLLAAVVLAAKRLIPTKGAGGWVASFAFVWGVVWTLIHNMHL
jgi:hypothetical protein